jgi:hypothetical protein
MKRLLFVLGMLIIGLTSDVLKAQTNVSGIISSNTTWSITGSPYIITGNVLLDSGYTLTIQPGVTVKFNRGISLQIDGELLVRGTSSNKITFTSNVADSAGAWGYIYFSDNSVDAVFENNIYGAYLSGSILEYCVVQYAGGANVTDNGAIRLNAAHPFINYCTISNNRASGIRAYNLTAGLKITNSIIKNNTSQENGAGIYFYNDPNFAGSASSLISNNSISNNHAESFGGGIWAQVCNSRMLTISNNTILDNSASNGGGIYNGYHGDAFITDNIIIRNTANNTNNVDAGGGGVYINDYSATTVSDNIISNNISLANGGGICNINQCTVNIANNIIADNSSVYLGGGIYNWYTLPTMSSNLIIRNISNDDAGIYCSNGFTDNIMSNTVAYNRNTDYNNTLNRCILLTSYDIATINRNNIFNNSTYYQLYNENAQGTPNVNAINNWWGTSNDLQVQAKIYDWSDNGNLGVVNYSPFLTKPDTTAPVSPPVNVIKSNPGGGQVKLTWSRNPEPDIAGYHIYYSGFNGYSFNNIINLGNDTSYILSGVSISDTIGVTAYDRTYSPANVDNATIVNDNMTNGNESWFTIAVDTLNTAVITHNEIPIQYSLQQNYPNPFNPTTTIKYSLPKAGNVRLTVYNAIGSKVATIVNEYKPAGNYSVQFNGSNLASGIYLYRLESGNYSAAKKFILMK